MKADIQISPFQDVKVPEEILERFAGLIVRTCLLIYALPVAISVYRNFFIEPTNLGIPIIVVYGLTLILAWRQNLLAPRTQIGLMILLLSLGSIAITIRNESIMSASTTVLFASMALMILVGLRWALSLSLIFLIALFALYVSIASTSLIYGTIHIVVAVGIQIGLLIALNVIWGMFITSRQKLEQTIRLAEIATGKSRIGLFRHDQNSDMWLVNEIYRQMYGIQHDQPIHGREHVMMATHAEDQPAIIEAFKNGLKIGENLTLEHRLRGDLGARWVRVNISMLEEDGHPVAYGSVVDIHDQKLRQNELDEIHAENAALIEHLRLATDEADIRIVEENLTAKTARFITRGKSPRKTAPTYEDRLELVPQDYIEQLKQAYSEPGAIAEYPILGKTFLTGVEWLRQLYVRKYQRDGEEFALFMVNSITQQKKAQMQLERSFKQLEQSLARLDEIARAGKIGLFDWARESDILRPNAIFREQTGLTEELYPIISTRNFFELFSDEEGMACFNQLRAAAPDSQAMEYQLKMRLKTGDVRWVRLIASVHQPKGEGAKVSGSLIDLTEHLELEQQLREANNALQRQSRTDPLTQVANRRELDEYLYTQHGMRQRDPHSDFSLLMIDIDYFKDYNDMYGHPLGDKALKCVADLMRKVARRPSDLVARFGGEEFVIVLPETDAEGALKLARQIQQKLDAEEILHEGSPFKQLTISIGIAALKPEEITTPAELIQLADTALYSAKSLGRNRVELAHQPAKATHPHHSE